MKTKWMLFWTITGLYSLGIIGACWYTYVTNATLHTTQPTILPIIETIKIALILLGGLGVVLPTFLNIFNSLEGQKTIEDRIRFDIIENTYELLERWNTPALLDARRFSRDLADKQRDLSTNALIAEIEKRPELKQSIIQLNNYFEGVRVSIKYGRVDVHVVCESLYYVFNSIFERYKPYIAEKLPAQNLKDLDELKVLLEKAKSK